MIESWTEAAKVIGVCYGVVVLLAMALFAWFVPKFKNMRPRIIKNEITDAEVMKEPKL